MCVLIVSTIFVSTICHLRRIQSDITIMYIGIHVKYSLVLSDFTET